MGCVEFEAFEVLFTECAVSEIVFVVSSSGEVWRSSALLRETSDLYW